MKYLVIYERPGKNWGAYVPALDGCVATGKTKEETAQRIKEAIHWHIDSLRSHGEPVPPPSAIETDFVEAA